MVNTSRPAYEHRQYWLLKSDPDSFSFDALWSSPNRTTHWDGVRNFQARNYMRDEMKKGDLAFFYHSGEPDPGIHGIVEIVRDRMMQAGSDTHDDAELRAVALFLFFYFTFVFSINSLTW